MATTTGKTHCVICKKEKVTFKCGGCSEEFCYKHLGDHQQELNKHLDELEVNRDLFRQSLTECLAQPHQHQLMEEIHRWEMNSIELIQQTAEEVRQTLMEHLTTYFHQMEIKLNKLTDQLRRTRQENDFNEISLQLFQEELNRLTKELTEPSTISIEEEDPTSFISKITVGLSETSALDSDLDENTLWIQDGATIAGGNGLGDKLDQLIRPVGIFIDSEQTIYVADNGNHRIMEWKSGAIEGQVLAGGHGQGNKTNQLNGVVDVVVDKEGTHLIICDMANRRILRWPRRNGTSGQILISNIDCCRLTIDNDGYLYISDREKHEVRRWRIHDTDGTLVAGGNGKGEHLNQLSNPTFLFVDADHSVYVSDWGNHRVMKWLKGATEGIIVAGGQGKGNGLRQISNPQGVVVDQFGSVYIADFNNSRIMCWHKEATEGTIVVGGNGQGEEANQLNRPMGLSLDQQGNLYVVDQWNGRVQKFHFNRN